MDKFIPILIIIAIYFFKFYNNYKEEQKKNAQRRIPQSSNIPPKQVKEVRHSRPKTHDYRERNINTGNRQSSSDDHPITKQSDRPVITRQPTASPLARIEKEKTKAPVEIRSQKVSNLHTHLPKVDIEIIELEDNHLDTEGKNKRIKFDLKDAVIKSAILNRPQI